MTYDKIIEEISKVGAKTYTEHKEWKSLSKKDLWKLVTIDILKEFCKLTNRSF